MRAFGSRSSRILRAPAFRCRLTSGLETSSCRPRKGGISDAAGFPGTRAARLSRETVVAEKFEALTKLGVLNSRMKDYYDLALLSRPYPFHGEELMAAVQRHLPAPGNANRD